MSFLSPLAFAIFGLSLPLVLLYGAGTAAVAYSSSILLGSHRVGIVILFGFIVPVAGVAAQAHPAGEHRAGDGVRARTCRTPGGLSRRRARLPLRGRPRPRVPRPAHASEDGGGAPEGSIVPEGAGHRREEFWQRSSHCGQGSRGPARPLPVPKENPRVADRSPAHACHYRSRGNDQTPLVGRMAPTPKAVSTDGTERRRRRPTPQVACLCRGGRGRP